MENKTRTHSISDVVDECEECLDNIENFCKHENTRLVKCEHDL